MSKYDHDVIVLGGGSAGLASALRAAHHGASVAMFEPNALGGTCVNLGCVPKKAMWHAAELAGLFPLAAALGFDAPSRPALGWRSLLQRRQQYIARIHASYARSLQDSGVRVVPARGRLLAADTVGSDDGLQLSARHVLIATGARPTRPDIPGKALGRLSDDFFALEAAPARVAIIGGGYIAVELSGLLQALGSEVTVLVRGQRLLEHFDAGIVEHLAGNMRQHGIDLRFGSEVTALEEAGGGQVRVLGPQLKESFDAVFFATGRSPNTGDVGLQAAGVALDKRGAVVVDARQCTSVPGVYAVGDVTAQLALTPVAVATGRRLMDHLLGGQAFIPIEPASVPSVVFAHPPLGGVGLTEQQARQAHAQVEVFHSDFRPMLAALGQSPTRSMFKVVCAGAEQRVVGIHLIGHGADEILQGFAVAMNLGMSYPQLRQMVAIHPTSAEEVLFAR